MKLLPLYLLVFLSTGSCRYGDCGGDYRRTMLVADIRVGSAPPSRVTFRVFEAMGDFPRNSFTGSFGHPGGSPLRGHVTSARLLTAQDAELLSFPVTPLGSGGFLPVAQGELPGSTGPDIIAAARGTGVFLELLTDLTAPDSLRIRLTVVEMQRLHRSACDWP